MALFLLLEPLFQRLHQLVPAAHFFDLRHFLWRQIFLGNRLQPIGGYIDVVLAIFCKYAFENLAKYLIETVQKRFVFDQCGAGQIIKFFGALVDNIRIQSGEKRKMLFQ